MSPRALRFYARHARKPVSGVTTGYWYAGRFAMTPRWRGRPMSFSQMYTLHTWAGNPSSYYDWV
jgi:hypothetical protein